MVGVCGWRWFDSSIDQHWLNANVLNKDPEWKPIPQIGSYIQSGSFFLYFTLSLFDNRRPTSVREGENKLATRQDAFCPIWGTSCRISKPDIRRPFLLRVESDRVSVPYLFNRGDLEKLRETDSINSKSRVILTRWLVEQHGRDPNSEDYAPQLTGKVIDQILNGEVRPLQPHEQANRLLVALSEYTSRGRRFLPSNVDEPKLLAASESADGPEARLLLDHLITQGFVNTDDRGLVWVSIPGFERVAELEQSGLDSKQVFIAMWFDPSTRFLGDLIADTTRGLGYDPFIVDRAHFGNKICDKIEIEIRRSTLLIADLTHDPDTGVRGSVYYEAGLAMGIGIPIVWTCREDQLNLLQFDVRQYPHIPWNEQSMEAFREQLADRMQVVLAR